ncbi:hypothetical protein LJC38_00060 [Parabacteroides sp. OttesenSCG-928-K15]|nr:hypothetical protein [Parabacteroides sp. OttesenSCG-928-K15]
MEHFFYINKENSKAVPFAAQLSENSAVGESWEDYNAGKWLLLNEEQVAFMEANPEASHFEVWNMELNPPAPEPEPYVPSAEEQGMIFMAMAAPAIFNTVPITDDQALQLPALHPLWENLKGQALPKDFRLKDVIEGVESLYITLQPILIVDDENQRPGNGAMHAHYAEVCETHAGTIDDPIPYDHTKGMYLEAGKFYVEDGLVGECIESVQSVWSIADLIEGGRYMKAVLPSS